MQALCQNAVILASASKTRRQLLERAGLDFRVIPVSVDEEHIKSRLREHGIDDNPADFVCALAHAKVLDVSRRHRDSVIIGADQILLHDGRILDKPDSVETARKQLLSLRGRSHRLMSAVACACLGEIVWTHCEQARLTMRHFTEEFLESYLELNGPGVCESVGGYRLEGLGLQLFETVEGDYFTILGLPLLALLGFLRDRSILAL
ncbi:MAG: Maf family nucleotide pyrophosphatase [Hyphomicrobiales bacterium]